MKAAFITWLALAAAASFVAPISASRADAALPAVTLPGGTTMIDDVGWYGISYRYTDGRTGSKALGWSGNLDADPATGIAALPQGDISGKRAYLMQPLWRNGTGDLDQAYRLALPKAEAITLAFSVAMRADGVGKSDGVTFRVFVDGDKLLDQNKADGAWSDFRFDLSRYAGQTITLVFEADPGPKNNPSFDFGLWGDRRIVCVGGAAQPAAPPEFLSASQAALDAVQTGWGSASPTHALSSGTAGIASVAGASPPELLDKLAFRLSGGSASALLPYANFASIDLVAPDGKIVPSDAPSVQRNVTQTAPAAGVVRRVAVYTVGSRTITVTAEIDRYDGSSVRLRLHSDDPYVAAVHFGRIGPTAFERRIPVPYYGAVEYAPRLGLFSNVVLDYGLSHASELTADNSAVYAPLTDGRRIALDETVYYAVSPHMADILPTPISGAASPYRQAMGDLAVIDFWGGSVPAMTNRLKEFSTYGLTRFLTIVHNWQHGGYDQQLPAVLPANDAVGGDAGVRALTSTAKAFGERVALHENYDDFYPNGPLYTVSDVAVRSDGSLIPAWMFPGHVSNLLTPVLMRKYAVPITTQVHDQLGTNASYIDVLSAITPYGHTDARATRPGAGEFITTVNAQRSLWQLMRDVHGGPTLGEGANHWYWSGMLDGVEAQFGVGIPQADAEDAPLFVDFDLLKMHPRQANHGMGYYNRWLKNPDAAMTPRELDDYRMQEIAYGHSPFLGEPLSDSGSLTAWEESNLAIPVASRYATAQVRSIAYDVNGALLDTDHAFAARGDFHRVRIVYANGLTIWANAQAKPWTVTVGEMQITLPQYGWAASGAGVLAYNAMRGGSNVSFARTADTIYANARTPIVAAAATLPAYAAPEATDVQQTGPQAFQVRFGYDVERAIPAGYRPFVHLVSPAMQANEGIVTQFPIGIDSAPAAWPVGTRTSGALVTATLPPNLPDGEYEVRVGLYGGSGRLPLGGLDDGSRRYRVARVNVANGTIIAASAISAPQVNASPLTDFGAMVTNGSVKLTRRGAGDWVLIPLPRDRAFEVALDGPEIDPAFQRIQAIAIDASGKAVGRAAALPQKGGRSLLAVKLPPGAVGFRLQAAGKT